MARLTLYNAAALFNARESSFNLGLTAALERRGYDILLPQREGFDFCGLEQMLHETMTQRDTDTATKLIIYLVDVGRFIPRADAVIANLDEPIDEGVVVEQCYARMMGKQVIGFRTDIRTPYGNLGDVARGMHFFPTFNCDTFISILMPNRTKKEERSAMKNLVNAIDREVEERPADYSHPRVAEVISYSDLLFNGIEDLHSEQGLRTIVERYVKHKDELQKLLPKIVAI